MQDNLAIPGKASGNQAVIYLKESAFSKMSWSLEKIPVVSAALSTVTCVLTNNLPLQPDRGATIQ